MPDAWYGLPAAAFGAFLLMVLASRRPNSAPSCILVGLYLLSSLAALVMERSWLSAFKFDHDPMSLIGYTALLTLALLPALRMRRVAAGALARDRLVELLFKVSPPLIWYSLLYHMPTVFVALAEGAFSTRRLQSEGSSLLPESPFTTAAVAIAQYYPVFTALFLLSVAHRRGLMLKVSLLAGSTLYLVSSLCFTARDGVVWYVLTFAWAYWTFQPSLTVTAQRVAKLVLVVVMAVGIALFATFTFDRFSEARSGTLEGSLVAYLGQQPYVFCEVVAEQQDFYGLALRFPLVGALTGPPEPVRRTKQYETTFGTFLRDFYGVSGWPSAVLLTCAFSLYFYRVLGSHRVSALRYLLLSALYFQFMSQGVFYFRLGTFAGNFYMVSIAGVSIALWIKRELMRSTTALSRSQGTAGT